MVNLQRFLRDNKMSVCLSKTYIWPGPKLTIPGKAHTYEITNLCRKSSSIKKVRSYDTLHDMYIKSAFWKTYAKSQIVV